MKFLRRFKDMILITTGVLSAGMGINGFLLSSHFIDGGVTGISMLLTNIFGFPISILLFILNLPFVFLGLRNIGWKFAIKTALAITALSLTLEFIPYPEVTPDKLLTALFGGFFIGTGIGLAMRGGAVLDGTEIAAVLLSKSSVLKVSDVILLINIVIFTSAAFFLGIEPALYSIVTYFAASKMIDFVINGIEEYTGVTIISNKSEEIKELIINKLQHGITSYKSTSGFGKSGVTNIGSDVIFTVITRLEISNLEREVINIDPNAVIINQSINDIKGGMITRRPLH
jgi:uncharacterized membrane-anchored protein YitT (DUF2179 family)